MHKAYIDAGGNAVWKMIVFKQNQHQIQQARQVVARSRFGQILK